MLNHHHHHARMEEPAAAAAAAATTCYTYRTAMALNNLGVAKMIQEQGPGGSQCYDAIETFKETFAFINSKQSIVPDGGVFAGIFLPSTTTTTTTRFVQQQAMKEGEQQHVSLHPALLQICPCDDDDMSAMMQALPSASVFAPISLRSRDFYDPQEGSPQNNTNLSLAIIMYNMGITYLLAHVQEKKNQMMRTAQHHQHDVQQQQELPLLLLHGAEVSLNTAQVMIDRHLTQQGSESKKLETLLVLAMILKSLMWMYRLENQNNQAKQTRAMLSRVLADIQHYRQYHLPLYALWNMNKTSTTSSAA